MPISFFIYLFFVYFIVIDESLLFLSRFPLDYRIIKSIFTL